ncbi:hypothetical protein E1B28_000189 [Marasmius oreades]|uniref:Uncharacterized protein n=1 Tax=Marasmius oreades TaxID=181124 RepID=A0A9P7V0X6_9AGAR|nr:uncharacterized protein E1B28_000189 [Marasmius oreades]KAG7098222.1 hypothetical protein E1B28_000189 [Marasmius oreades]
MLVSRPIPRNGEGPQRFGGAKTPAKGLQNENAIRHAPTSTVGKGNLKGNIPQTPFQSQSKSIKGDLQLKDVPRTGKGKAPIQLNTMSRPFLDKTPFPNRVVSLHTQTPFNRDLSETPNSPQIPSSTRKHIRLPRQSQDFDTPLNTKNHWDLSDDEVGMSVPVVPSKVLEVKEDYDEVEYMAPNTLDLHYQPPLDFELPDYKEVGKVLMDISRKLVLDEQQPPPEIVPKAEDITPVPWNMIPLLELEDDDPFGPILKKNPPPTRTTQSTMRNQSGPVSALKPTHPRSASTLFGTAREKNSLTTDTARSTMHNLSKPVPVPKTTHTRSASTTRPGTSSYGIRSNSHTRAASVSTHNARVASKPVMVTRHAPSKVSTRPTGDVTVKSKPVSTRRPATSISTYKPVLPPVRGLSGVSKQSIPTGPPSHRSQVATKTVNTKTEDEMDVLSLKFDLLKHDANEDFFFDV